MLPRNCEGSMGEENRWIPLFRWEEKLRRVKHAVKVWEKFICIPLDQDRKEKLRNSIIFSIKWKLNQFPKKQ